MIPGARDQNLAHFIVPWKRDEFRFPVAMIVVS
jgi:hypothetical protein